MSSQQRRYTLIDHGLMRFDALLRQHHAKSQRISSPEPDHTPGNKPESSPDDRAAGADGHPGASAPETVMTQAQRRHAAGLMRVNHAGEVAAQALYDGQSLLARSPSVREALQASALEERAHLQWCRARLNELDDAPSRLDRLWYTGSFAIGMAVAARGDEISLGFVAQTEQQVVQHLRGHLRKLPSEDVRSRANLEQMVVDEERHGAQALARGGRVPGLLGRIAMRIAAKVMTRTSYRF